VHSWHGNALALARAYSYLVVNGSDGLRRVSDAAVLNANWLRVRLHDTLPAKYDRPNMHEFVATASTIKRQTGAKALDIAKRLLEEGFHSPTMYFPLIVDEALMLEPTETESPQTLEALAQAFERIVDELQLSGPQSGQDAPRTTPVRRVDEARAARTLIPTFDARPSS
jgi:glycine dehydrogenase subunit 2